MMVTISLEEVIKETIENLSNGKIDKRIVSFSDYKNEYAILKPKVLVHVELKNGIVADIDVGDYFTKELNDGKKQK